MSEVRWCDTGGHPFSILGDLDRDEFYSPIKRRGDGTEYRDRLDICGPCNKRGTGLVQLNNPSAAPGELTTGTDVPPEAPRSVGAST